MAIEQVTLRFEGLLPLMMHNPRGLNPRDLPAAAMAAEIKVINDKKVNATDEDIERRARLEWELGLYHDIQTGPYLPSGNIVKCLQEGASATARKGKKLVAGILMDGLPVALEYDGPRDIERLYADGRFFDYRNVGVNHQKRVMRARPIFPQWAVQFSFMLNLEVLNHEDILKAARHSGQFIGLGEMRPSYGRFRVVEVR